MKLLLILSNLIFIINVTFALDSDYDAKLISEKMKDNANAVIRLNTNRLVKNNNEKAIFYSTIATTVLNENGKQNAFLFLPYNKFIKYKNISGVIYDESGKKKRKIKADEILDFSNVASYSLYEDQRVKMITPANNEYPYTIEYSYEMELNGILQYPTWNILKNYNISVENSSYTLVLPNGEEFRSKGVNFDYKPEISTEKETDVYLWEIENFKAVKSEPFTKNFQDIFPILYLSPIEFIYGGVSGDMSSWNSFGNWIWELMKDKSEFEEETEDDILKLVNNCKSDREKVDVLYKFMQNKVRYVNISIGLGGLEPISAQRVQDVSYGDCKALSNYMRSLLKVVGIQSFYTIVHAGPLPKMVNKDFPSSQFNHAILMVPMEDDSVWLECTSQRLPSGYLGDFTDNRTVLFISEEGGHLGKTPSFKLEENIISSKGSIQLDKYLNTTISRHKTFGGVHFNQEYSSFLNRDEVERKRNILTKLRLSDIRLDSFSYEINDTINPSITEKLFFWDDNTLSFTGDYIFLPLNLISDEVQLPTRVRNRNFPMFQMRDLLIVDTINFDLPEQYDIIETPTDTLLESEFGKYISKIIRTEKGLFFTRRIEYYSGEYPPEKYMDFYKFKKAMRNVDNQKVILRKRIM